MAAKEMKKATESLTCPVCLEIFKNPKYLPCYHSCCEKCLEKLHSQSKIICPECREQVIVPDEGVKSLPNNFLINHLIDELIVQRKIEGNGEEKEVKCDNCFDTDPVVSFCLRCSLFLCHVCNESHKRERRSASHMQDIIPLTELKSSENIPMRAKTEALMCEKHSIELLFYCETCEELICMYCAMKDHDGVKQLVGKHRKELNKVTAPIKEILDSLTEVRENLDKMVIAVQKCGDELEKDINCHYDEVMQNITKQKEEMTQYLQCIVSQKIKAIEMQIEELEHLREEMLNIAELKDQMEKSFDQEMLSAKKQVINHMEVAMKKYNEMDIQPLQSATMEFMPIRESFPRFGKLLIHVDPVASEVVNLPQYAFVDQTIEFTIITKYGSGCYCSKGESQVSVQLQYVTGEIMVAKIRDNNDGSYTVSFAPEQAGKANLFVSVNGLHIRENPYTIMVHRSYLAVSKPSSIVDSSGKMGQLWSIAFNQNGMWAVTDSSKHRIYLFNEQNELVLKFGAHGSSSGHFNLPYGVAFDADNYLYIVDGGNHRVQKFNITSRYLLQFGSKGSNSGQLNNPHGVSIHDDKVYVADSNNQRISVFQKSGKFCYIIGEGQLDAPYDLSVNRNNLLLVVDHNQHCVCTFTLEGKFVSKFGSKGNLWGQLTEPCNLITDINDCILVSDTGNHRVLIFDKDGNCFGCITTCTGQFNCPRGIALSSNGSIYINDSSNKIIKVFSTF